MLLGLIPPTTGQILLLGEPPSRATRRRIGYVPQGLGLYDDLTVAENLEFAAAVFGARRVAPPHRTRRGRADRRAPRGPAIPVGQLPLGVQRRAAFAQALAHQPELLILDEPTSGVDPLGRARLWQTIAGAVAGRRGRAGVDSLHGGGRRVRQADHHGGRRRWWRPERPRDHRRLLR